MNEGGLGDRDLVGRLVRASRWLAPVCLAVIVVLSIVPAEQRPHTGMSGNLEHFLAYAGTGVALVSAIRAHRVALATLLLCVLSGGLEIAQIWIPGRSAGLDNWIASSAGALVGSFLAYLLLTRVRR